jgi:O-acetyl-ADP-ribose deacetylase (regulator of RNase III)
MNIKNEELVEGNETERVSLIVKNLHRSTTDESFRDIFESYGTIVSCKINRVSNRSTLFGFVKFASPIEASAAIEGINGTVVASKKIIVLYQSAQDKIKDTNYNNSNINGNSDINNKPIGGCITTDSKIPLDSTTLFGSRLLSNEDSCLLSNVTVSIWEGDITTLKIGAIVNAANESLLGGGGIDGAIHKAAGPQLLAECKTLNGCKVGETKITKAYDLRSIKNILHTVGPRYNLVRDKNKSQELLSSCYHSCLEVAVKNGIRSLAFCSISTGVFQYPLADATMIALTTVRDWLAYGDNKTKIDLIVFCVYHPNDKERSKIKMVYNETMKKVCDEGKLSIDLNASANKVNTTSDHNSPVKESAIACTKVRDDYIVNDKLFQQEEERYCASGLLFYRYNAANEMEILIGNDDGDDDVYFNKF